MGLFSIISSVLSLQGTTKLLLIKIPFYKEIIVSSFSCNHCGFNNNGIQSGAAIQDKGITYDLLVTKTEVHDTCVFNSMQILF